MAKNVIRYQIADYLGIPATGETTTFHLMGTGFNTLDESPTATVDKKAYISDKSATGTITGYENVFAFDSDLMSDEQAIMALYDVGRNQKTGADAQFSYVRVELFKTGAGNAYPARKFTVAAEIASISGAGAETVKVSGNLHQVGNFVDGTFNPTTKTFTEVQE